MDTTMINSNARRTAQALWILIEQQPQEVKDYLVHIIKSSPASHAKENVCGKESRLKALKGCLKDVPIEKFADDERAQYILSK